MRNSCKMLRKDGVNVTFYLIDAGICVKVIVNEGSTYIFEPNTNDKGRLCSILHDAIALRHFIKLSGMKSQGHVTMSFAMSPRSQVVMRGYTVPPKVWLFAIKARNNNLPLLYRNFRVIKSMNIKCRRCNAHPETAAHVLNQCISNEFQATRKHNAVLELAVEFFRGLGMDVDVACWCEFKS